MRRITHAGSGLYDFRSACGLDRFTNLLKITLGWDDVTRKRCRAVRRRLIREGRRTAKFYRDWTRRLLGRKV
jgi:hypothetical protein